MRIRSLHFTICCFCFVSIGASVTYSGKEENVNTPQSLYSILRQIQYSFTLQNKSNRLLEKAEFWTYAPVKQTSTQRCINIEASHPYQLIEDEFGNQILYFEFHNLPPYATKIISIKADLVFSNTSTLLTVKDIQIFLKAEKNVESDSPEISQLAKKLQSPTPIKTVENIFQWVSENIKYTGYLRDERGALYALKNKEGDCTEFADLFVALSRASNIPTRSIGGYVYSNNAILKASDYHNWAEFYDDGVWKIADPQKKVFAKNQSSYIAMRILGESPNNPMGEYNRFHFSGDGLKVRMN